MNDTVFILGAGASMPFGLPSGKELIQSILHITDPEMDEKRILMNEQKSYMNGRFTYGFLKKKFEILKNTFSNNEIFTFHEALRLSNQSSIDNFIRLRKEYEDISKLSIAIGILMAENVAKIFPERHYSYLHDNWYQYLWSKIGNTLEDYSKSRISIITFNYDRSLEYYLSTVIKNSFSLDERKVEEVFRSLPIFHVYGSLGSVFKGSNNEYLPYGLNNIEPSLLKYVSQRISTIHEFIDSTIAQKVESILTKASRIYFLGFGYHLENMGVLNIGEKGNRHIIGSAYEFVDKEIDELKRYFPYISKYYNMKNLDFIRNCVSFK